MINEDYVEFIRQKYRCAIVIAVIKTKPSNKTMEEYISNLKDNFNKAMNTSDNISVCEDDFNFSDNESVKSVTILKDFEFNDLNIQQNGNVVDLQGIGNMDDQITTPNSQSTFCETQNSLNLEKMADENTYYCMPRNNNLKVTSILDSEITELYTVNAFTDKHTHVSQSQDNLEISNKYFLSKSDTTNGQERTSVKNTQNDLNFDVNYSVTENNSKLAEINLEGNKIQDKNKMVLNNTAKSIDSSKNMYLSQDFTELFDENAENIIDSQKIDNINIYITADSECGTPLNLSYKNRNNNNNEPIKCSKNNSFSQNVYSFDEFEYFTDSSQNFTLNSLPNTRERDGKGVPQINMLKGVEDKEDKIEVLKANLNEVDTFNDISKDYDIQDVTESQVELVTFKVLEELNKVKNYLNKKERNSERCRSSQFEALINVSDTSVVSVSSVNESAHCLLRHITSSALLSRTMHITSHVSKVLGNLIDNLHEEEKYPNFLECLLETIDSLLQYIYTGDNCEENIILKKEQAINRLFLLNRSSHIIQYTIQKITVILLETIQYIKMDYFEIKHPDIAENICHIFHVLEILLHRYTKIQINTQTKSQTQSSQSSQETLRKSALTETWRRRWSGCEMLGVEKEEKFSKSYGGERVLKECSKVLRTLLVDAMDGFGLVAFSALTCYNLLQN